MEWLEPFAAAVEETLVGLHEGNFALYHIRPSEFEEWNAVWNASTKSKEQDSSVGH